MSAYPLTAAATKNEFKRAGIHFVVALPDRVTSHHLLKGLIADPDYKVVQVCKEDEGVSICSGLYAAGHKSVLMMQYTGFLDSINAIRGIAVEGKFPVCIVVGLLGKEPDVAPAKSFSKEGKNLSTFSRTLLIELKEVDMDCSKKAASTLEKCLIKKNHCDIHHASFVIPHHLRLPRQRWDKPIY